MNLKLPRGYSNSRNLDYSRTAGIRNGGSFKPLGETVCELGVESTVGSFIQTPPTYILFLEFQNSGLFQNRGNVLWREFQTSR